MKRKDRLECFTLAEDGTLRYAKIVIAADAACMSPNRLALMKPLQRAALDHKWQNFAICEWTRTFHLFRAHVKMPGTPASIRFTIHRKARMDIDNLAASRCLKEIVDGLVIVGALPGDDAAGVSSVKTEAKFGITPPIVIVEITWASSPQ